MAKKVYQIKATIAEIKPPIWRRVVIPDSMSLDALHFVLQKAFGWEGYHMHEFEVGRVHYGTTEGEDWGDEVKSESARVSSILKQGTAFTYLYDFGDSWEHKLKVEKVSDADPGTRYPVCLAGSRACPPEDCGGPWGYQDLLEALSDPSHPEHDEMWGWVGEGFDPEAFDPSKFNL